MSRQPFPTSLPKKAWNSDSSLLQLLPWLLSHSILLLPGILSRAVSRNHVAEMGHGEGLYDPHKFLPTPDIP